MECFFSVMKLLISFRWVGWEEGVMIQDKLCKAEIIPSLTTQTSPTFSSTPSHPICCCSLITGGKGKWNHDYAVHPKTPFHCIFTKEETSILQKRCVQGLTSITTHVVFALEKHTRDYSGVKKGAEMSLWQTQKFHWDRHVQHYLHLKVWEVYDYLTRFAKQVTYRNLGFRE